MLTQTDIKIVINFTFASLSTTNLIFIGKLHSTVYFKTLNIVCFLSHGK